MSCASLRACFVVSQSDNGYWTLQRWDGSVWTAPPYVGAWFDEVYAEQATAQGVSCDSPASCTVAGYDKVGGFAARFPAAGPDVSHAAPVPGSHPVVIDGISCTHGACMAVGGYQTTAEVLANSPFTHPLAELYR